MKKFLSVVLVTLLILSSVSFSISAKSESKFYVALGDSIAAGTKLFNADVQSYAAIIAKTESWDYVNYAVPGHTTYALCSRLDLDEVKEAVSKADYISLSIGGNNFLLNGMTDMLIDALLKDDYTKMDEIINDFYTSFDECIKKIKAINPNAKLFVQTLYNPMPGKVGEAYAEGQQRLNNAYKEYLIQNPDAYTIVDIEPLFEGHAEYIATDFIHPNKKGHLVIANAYLKKFEEMGIGDKTVAVEPTLKEILSFDISKTLEDLIFQFTNTIRLMFSSFGK